jgi:hypothetical protein
MHRKRRLRICERRFSDQCFRVMQLIGVQTKKPFDYETGRYREWWVISLTPAFNALSWFVRLNHNKDGGVENVIKQSLQYGYYFFHVCKKFFQTEVSAMSKKILSVGLVALFATPLSAFSQTTTWVPILANQQIQNVYWHQVAGCSCGIYPTHTVSQMRSIFVDPTSITSKTGKDVQIRYDASANCNGQTIQDDHGTKFGTPGFKGVGTIEWEPGVIQELPELAGIATLKKGFSEATSYPVKVNIAVQCFDSGAKCTVNNNATSCPLSVVIPVSVTKKKPVKPPSLKQSPVH